MLASIILLALMLVSTIAYACSAASSMVWNTDCPSCYAWWVDDPSVTPWCINSSGSSHCGTTTVNPPVTVGEHIYQGTCSDQGCSFTSLQDTSLTVVAEYTTVSGCE